MEDAVPSTHQHDPETMEMVREHLLPAELADRVAGVFWSLADPTRARIVHALTLAELCNADIADLVGLTESAVSHQMRELRLLNIVRAERQGRMVFYRLNDTHVRHIFEDTLRHVQESLE
jgi:DNA-binding transcriptional ArsR family regulator